MDGGRAGTARRVADRVPPLSPVGHRANRPVRRRRRLNIRPALQSGDGAPDTDTASRSAVNRLLIVTAVEAERTAVVAGLDEQGDGTPAQSASTRGTAAAHRAAVRPADDVTGRRAGNGAGGGGEAEVATE